MLTHLLVGYKRCHFDGYQRRQVCLLLQSPNRRILVLGSLGLGAEWRLHPRTGWGDVAFDQLAGL